MLVSQTTETLSTREEEIRKIVGRLAAAQSVGAEFEPGRRASDVTLVRLRGRKQDVLALPLSVLDALPNEDLEVLGSLSSSRAYTLRLVITERLEKQTVNDLERRAKLRYFLQGETV